MDAAVLMLGERVIARLEDMQPDMPWRRAWRLPWFVGRVTTMEAFREVEPLFRRELALTESAEPFDADEWQATWEQLWQRGVTLLLPDGSRFERDFAVHVYEDGTARFRYQRRCLGQCAGMSSTVRAAYLQTAARGPSRGQDFGR